jgi:hypothetical protein
MMNRMILIAGLVGTFLLVEKGTGRPFVLTDGHEIGIQVMGTIVQRQSEDNVALLKLPGGAVKAVKRGAPISDQIRVLTITSDYIEVRDGSAQVYRIQPDKFSVHAHKKNAAQTHSVSQEIQPAEDTFHEDGFERQKGRIKMTGIYRDKLIKEDLARVLMQATVEPFHENGMIAGFKISQIDAGSIYDKAGLLNGDIITHINDQELTSVANSIKLLQSLKGAQHMDVDIRRGEQRVRMTMDVE